MAKRETLPSGFRCICGAEHIFSGYVYGHWHVPLKTTCDPCGRSWSLEQGDATLYRDADGKPALGTEGKAARL